MRILMVTSFYPPHHFGGDGTYVRQLTQALRRRGHEVDVTYCHDAYRASGGDKPLSQVSPDPGVHQLKSRLGFLSPLYSHVTGSPGFKMSGFKQVMRKPYDVIHFHNISLMGGPRILSALKAPVKVFTAHEHWTICPTHILWKNGNKACDTKTCFTCQIRSARPPQLWRYTSLLQDCLEHVDWIFAPSDFTQNALREGGVTRPISVLPLFCAETFETKCSERAASARPRFVFAGRITASKGVEGLARLFASRPHLDLDIIGEGDQLERLKRTFSASTHIRWLGAMPQDTLKRRYREAHALVLPSLAPETFGLVTLEAFSQGTPAIVRDAGGAAETVRASGAGIVFKTDDEAGVAVDKLAGNSALRDELGLAARQYFVDYGTEAQHVSAYLAKLDELNSIAVVEAAR